MRKRKYLVAVVFGFFGLHACSLTPEYARPDAANAFLMREEKKRREASEQAQEAYRIVSVRYAAGAEAFLAVLDAQRTMLGAEDAVVTVTLARLNASTGLFKALGGGWAENVPSGNISQDEL